MIFVVDIDQSMEEFLRFLYSITADRQYTDTNNEHNGFVILLPTDKDEVLSEVTNASSVFILGPFESDATTLMVVYATNWYRPRTPNNNNTIPSVLTNRPPQTPSGSAQHFCSVS